jgi:hypothetical protein
MSRLAPPLLTTLAIWALCLAESHADSQAPWTADDPACLTIAEGAAPAGGAAFAPGCPDPLKGERP